MTVESATYISGLNATLPTGADAKAEGDDHIRLLKSTILATFPGMTGAMTGTHTQINKLVSTFSIVNAASSALTIDAGGNVGLGVSPSSWGGTSKALQFSTGAIEARSSSLNFWQNAYYNGANPIYVANGAASDYYQTTGGHAWLVAPVGVAGNVITFVQAMTLDNSGNLITTANASTPLLSANNQMVFSLPSNTQLMVSVRGSDGVTRTANIALA